MQCYTICLKLSNNSQKTVIKYSAFLNHLWQWTLPLCQYCQDLLMCWFTGHSVFIIKWIRSFAFFHIDLKTAYTHVINSCNIDNVAELVFKVKNSFHDLLTTSWTFAYAKIPVSCDYSVWHCWCVPRNIEWFSCWWNIDAINIAGNIFKSYNRLRSWKSASSRRCLR